MMKTTYLLIATILLFTLNGFAQEEGTDCESAYEFAEGDSSDYEFSEGQEEMYYLYTPTNSDVIFRIAALEGESFADIVTIELYEYTDCENLTLEYSFTPDEDEEKNNYSLLGLNTQSDYLIILKRDVNAELPQASFLFWSRYLAPIPCPAIGCLEELSNGGFSNLSRTLGGSAGIPVNAFYTYLVGTNPPVYESIVCEWESYHNDVQLFNGVISFYSNSFAQGTIPYSEAIYQTVDILPGVEYEISIDLWETSHPRLPDEFRITLLDASLPPTHIANNTNQEIILSVPSSQITTTATNFSATFSTTQAYDQLIIYSVTTSTISTDRGWVSADNVELKRHETVPHNSDVSWISNSTIPHTGGGGSPVVLSKKSLYIDGDFIVDEDLTLLDCNITMKEDGQITVNNGAELIIRDTDELLNEIKTCETNTFWDGIFVDGASGASIKIEGSSPLGNNFFDRHLKISDMREGIVVTDLANNYHQVGYDSYIKNTFFDHNIRSIKLDNSNVTSGRSAFVVTASEFDCTTPLIDNGITFYPSRAIEVYNFRDYNTAVANRVGFLMNPTTSQGVSKINGRAGGIYLSGSDAKIITTTFEGFNNYTSSSPWKQDLAIEVVNSQSRSSIAPSVNLMRGNGFYECRSAISSKGHTVLTVRDNDYNYDVVTLNYYPWKKESHFLYIDNNEEPVVIEDNEIYNVTQGILTEAATDLTIQRNEFDLEVQANTSAYSSKLNDEGFAIITRNVHNSINATCVIDNNTIKHAKIGIQAWFTTATISNNTIEDLNDHFMQSNNCAPFNPCPPPPPAYGIRVLNAERSFTVSSNTVKNNLSQYATNPENETRVIGISLENSLNVYNLASTIQCNKTENTGVGLQFAGSNDAGTVVGRNNMKSNYYGFLLANNGFIGDVGSSGSANDNEWNGTFGASETFSDNSDGSNCTLYVQSGGVYDPLIQASHNSNGLAIVKDNTGNSSSSAFSCSAIQRVKGGNTGRGLAIGNSNFKARNMAKGKMNYMQHASDSAVRLNQQLLYWQLAKDSIKANDSLWKPFADSMKTTNMGKAFGKNRNGHSAANNIDLNLNEVTVLQEKRKAQQILTAQEIRDLGRIALLCPYYDGLAVYLARNILLDLGYGNFSNACEWSAPQLQNQKRLKSNVEQELLIYPNPTQSMLNLEFVVEEAQEVEVKLFDVLGKEVLQKDLHEGKFHQLHVEGLRPGIYILKLTNKNQVIQTDKIIVE